MRPSETSNHAKEKPFMFADINKCSHVFVRKDLVTAALTPPYDGPFLVLKRGPKVFKVLIKNKPINITVDRLKPAFGIKDDQPSPPNATGTTQKKSPTDQPVDPVTPKTSSTVQPDVSATSRSDPTTTTEPKKKVTFANTPPQPRTTRSGRIVKLPAKFT